jgi:hypothetical protein
MDNKSLPPDRDAQETVPGKPYSPKLPTASEMAQLIDRARLEPLAPTDGKPEDMVNKLIEFIGGLAIPAIDDTANRVSLLEEKVAKLRAELADLHATGALAEASSSPIEEPERPNIVSGADDIRRTIKRFVLGAGLDPDCLGLIRVDPAPFSRVGQLSLRGIIHDARLLSAAKLPYNLIPSLPEGMDLKLAQSLTRYGAVILRHPLRYDRGAFSIGTRVMEGVFGDVSIIPGYESMTSGDSNTRPEPTLSEPMGELAGMLAIVAAMTHSSSDMVEGNPNLKRLADSWLGLDREAQNEGMAAFNIINGKGGIPTIDVTSDGRYFFVHTPIGNGLSPILSRETIKRQDGKVEAPDPLVASSAIVAGVMAVVGVWLYYRDTWGFMGTVEDYSAYFAWAIAGFMATISSRIRVNNGLPIDDYGVAHGLFGIRDANPANIEDSKVGDIK